MVNDSQNVPPEHQRLERSITFNKRMAWLFVSIGILAAI